MGGGGGCIEDTVVLMPEVKDTCPFFPSNTVFSFSVYFYTQRVKVCALLLERKELICRLATPPTPASKQEREREDVE